VLPVLPGQPCATPCLTPAAPQTFRFGVFGEYLYLRPGNSTTIDYAIPVNSAVVPPLEPFIPIGPLATINPEYDSGFRVGGWWQRTCESQLALAYTHFESQTQEGVAIDPANNVALIGLILHPATANANTFFDVANARYDVEYKTIDIDYRHVMCSDCAYKVSYVAGVRFLHYQDELGVVYSRQGGFSESVEAENEFDGFGLRGGLEGEFGGQQGGLLGYGRILFGAVAGEMQSSFEQQTGGIVTVTTSRADDRILPTIEAELGVGWRSRNQRWRLSVGYNITALFNVASANSLVRAVHTGSYEDNDDTFTLDGAVARIEFAF
jgi:hypothetical protein